eukprot:5619-Heterococcus_DN1.PRE.1
MSLGQGSKTPPYANWRSIRPEDVLTYKKPTAGVLCPLTANTYGIEYLEFTILDYQTKNVIFNVGKDNPPPMDLDMDLASLDENSYRSIKYDFSEDVLRLPSIQTTLVFSVGNREMPNFRMVERHYFRDELVKSYDFKFGFCIPSSTNTWDAVYAVPPLDDDLINDMINNPHLTRSDRSVLYMLMSLILLVMHCCVLLLPCNNTSFYFVDNQLVMHNKASYKYTREDAAQAKKSYEQRYGSKGSKTRKAASASSKAHDDSSDDDDEADAEAKQGADAK